MKKAIRQFTLYAMLSIFVLLTVLLGIINALNLTMAASDADNITEMLSERSGAFGPQTTNEFSMRPQQGNFPNSRDRSRFDFPFGEFRPFDRMGVDSPELSQSLRYFTVAFDRDGTARTVAYSIAAVTEQEAVEWARSLLGESTGWTKLSYRYRVYSREGSMYVTVIDQSRELLPAYRILMISVIGELVGLVLSFIVLLYAGKRVFRPIDEADRKQRRFIQDAENECKVPLTVISANLELIEAEHGPSDPTRAIHRQVSRMTQLVKRLGSFTIFADPDAGKQTVELSALVESLLRKNAERFRECGIAVEQAIEPAVTVSGNEASLSAVVAELIDNACKYGMTKAVFSLKKENSRVTLSVSNDCTLPDGSYEQVFDRFTTLENGGEGVGMGLSHVKEIVRAHAGRVFANVSNGMFTVRCDL